jgi:hypothetical protein
MCAIGEVTRRERWRFVGQGAIIWLADLPGDVGWSRLRPCLGQGQRDEACREAMVMARRMMKL